MVRFNRIVTHESPDMDAILSVLLLQLYGEDQFPGVATASVEFCPAGLLPDGLSPEALEREGVMAVDTGGGRFDSHPGTEAGDRGDAERSASDLVAEAVGVIDSPQWRDLVEFVRLHDTEGMAIQSTDHVHHIFTIPNILAGMAILCEGEPDPSELILRQGFSIFKLPAAAFECRESTPGFDYRDLTKDLASRARVEWDKAQETTAFESAVFLDWLDRLEKNPDQTISPQPRDRVVSLPAIVQGLYQQTGGETDKILERFGKYVGAVLARERRWWEAVQEVDSGAVVHPAGKKVRVVQMTSDNGLVIKALRFRTRADLIVYRHATIGATSFLLKRRGPLKYFRMSELAAAVRIAECIEENSEPEYSRLFDVGMVHGWFLHQSENLLIRGSKKATEFTASAISVDNLVQIAISQVDPTIRIPENYCPADHCTFKACRFYRLRLSSCRSHRARLDAEARAKRPVRPGRPVRPVQSVQSIRKPSRPDRSKLSDFGEKLLSALESKKKPK